MVPFDATNKNRLVPNMLAAGANRKITLIRIFSEKLFVQLQKFINSISFLILSFFPDVPSEEVSFN